MHKPVLLDQTIEQLLTDPQGVYVDGTVGGGGHLRALAARLKPPAVIIGLDRDGDILKRTAADLTDLNLELHLKNANFAELDAVVKATGFSAVDGIMMDLGVSSFQIDEEERGFSYQFDVPLDMRMDRRQEIDAAQIVNTWEQKDIRQILWDYGEERYAPQIAAAIVKERLETQITTTGQLVDVIKRSVPAAYRRAKHPARRTFQALRIAVNQELEAIEQALPQAFNLLKPGGRLAIITFHSLEDRLVKRFMAERCTGCICPPKQPVCTCHRQPAARLVTRKPIAPSDDEVNDNPRARSARLRVVEKLS
ncbi:MAG: 16S rRNA (cytosine(1402)-N(4))-methyltransferase RsmH [Methylocystaceae bacterium]